MRNKFLTKILGATLGLAMAIGVGVGVANYNNKAVKEVNAAASNWVEVTSLSGVKAGESYVIATSGGYYINETLNKGHLSVTEISDSNPASSTAAGVVQFVSVSSNIWKIKFVSSEKYLKASYCTTGNFKLETSDDTDGWLFSYDATGFNAVYQKELLNKSGGNTHGYVNLRSNGDTDFRSYKASGISTPNTGNGSAFKLYQYQAGKTLSSIAVSTAPTKTTYYAGDFFDPTGLVITRNYSDTTSDTYAYAGHAADFSFSPSTTTALTTENTSVSITYGGKTTSQSITVNPARSVSSVAISGDMDKKDYYEGDDWDLTGLYLTVTWNTGTPNPTTVDFADLTLDTDYSLDHEKAELGDTSLYICGTYGGEDFEGTITGITVSELPKVVTYSIASKTSVTKTGNAPAGVNASYAQTYDNGAGQATGGNSMTLTLSGFSKNTKITGIVMNMKSNASSGAGGLTYQINDGSEQALVAAETGFNTWGDNDTFGNTYRDVTIGNNLSIEIPVASTFVLTTTASANSLYIASYTISYDYLQPRITAEPTYHDVYVSETAVSTVTASYFDSDPTLSYEVVSGADSISNVVIGSLVSHQATVTITASSIAGVAVVKVKDSANPNSYYANITVNVAASAKDIVEDTLDTRSTLSYRYTKSGNIDTLTCASIANTGSGYDDWEDRTGNVSNAVYAGITYAGNETAIQFNNSANAGIVTTTSGGTAKNVSVVWGNSTANGRTLDVYGKNAAYTSAADLYDEEKCGTKIGSIVKGSSTSIDFSGYEYIGVRPAVNAMYFESIQIQWGDASYNYSKVALRFGGSIDPSLWGDLNEQSTILSYGVMISSSASIASRYQSNNGVLEEVEGKNYKQVVSTDIRVYTTELATPSSHPVADANGDYGWNLYVGMENASNSDLTRNYTAVAYIMTNEGIVFFGETTKSAAQLAYELAHGTTADADNNLEGSLNNLADLYVPA